MINQKFQGKTYPKISYQIGFEKLKEFLLATKANLEKFSEIVPPTFPVVYQHELLSAVLFDSELKLNLKKLVHGEQEFIYYKPVKAGDTITSTGKIEKIFQKGPHDFVVFVATSINQVNEKVCDSIWTFVIRQGNDTDFTLQEKLMMKVASVLPESSQYKASRQAAINEMIKLTNKTFQVDSPKQDLIFFEKSLNKLIMKVLVDKYMPQIYAGASRDFNIIHLDDQFGKSVGLGSNILHGMATMALGANFACIEIDDVRSIKKYKARFSAPVRPLDTLTYEGQWDGKIFHFKTLNQNKQEVLGHAQVELI